MYQGLFEYQRGLIFPELSWGERTYLDIMKTACPPETWKEVVSKAIEDAKKGDAKAREWLASYIVGKPEHTAPTLKQIAIDEAAGVDEIKESDLLLASL